MRPPLVAVDRHFGLAGLALVFLAACGGPKQLPPPLPPPQVNLPPKVDRVLVFKERHRMYLLNGATIVETFPIALGKNPVGRKEREGDKRTPEGLYWLDRRNPNSQYYRSIHISYPNDADRARAARAGVSPGNNVMIHGLPNGSGEIGLRHMLSDWTDGCIAVTNEQMDVIWQLVGDNTRIEVYP